MKNAILSLGNKQFVLGLVWSIAGPRPSVSRLKSEGWENQAESIALMREQYGFAQLDAQSAKRCIALASALGTQEEQLLLFTLKDHNGQTFWWLYAYIDGQILPGLGDSVFWQEEDALQALADIQKLLPASYHDKVLRLEEQQAIAWLAEHLQKPSYTERLLGYGRLYALSRYHGQGVFLIELSLLVLLALALAFWAVGSIHDYFTAQGFTLLAKQRLAKAEIRRDFIQKHPDKVWTTPWANVLDVYEAGQLCQNLVNEQALVLQGWLYHESLCSLTGKTVHNKSTYRYTPRASYFQLPVSAHLDPSKPRQLLHSAQTYGQTLLGAGEDWQKLFDCTYLRTWFLQYAQSYRLSASLRFAPKEVLTEKDVGTFTCPWAKGEWHIKDIPNHVLLSSLAPLRKLPGLTLKSLHFDQHTWQIKGEVYGL